MGTGIEPQRNPTGLGVAISNVPTQRRSPEVSELEDDDDDDFAIGIRYLWSETKGTSKENPQEVYAVQCVSNECVVFLSRLCLLQLFSTTEF